jgi:hypothetical protein
MSGFFNILKEGAKKAFGKGSNKNLTPELKALKGFKVSPKGGKTDTNQYLLKKGIQDVKKRNKASKELFRKATKKGDK